MKTIILAALAVLAIAATSMNQDPTRTRLAASLEWGDGKGFALDLRVGVDVGV